MWLVDPNFWRMRVLTDPSNATLWPSTHDGYFPYLYISSPVRTEAYGKLKVRSQIGHWQLYLNQSTGMSWKQYCSMPAPLSNVVCPNCKCSPCSCNQLIQPSTSVLSRLRMSIPLSELRRGTASFVTSDSNQAHVRLLSVWNLQSWILNGTSDILLNCLRQQLALTVIHSPVSFVLSVCLINDLLPWRNGLSRTPNMHGLQELKSISYRQLKPEDCLKPTAHAMHKTCSLCVYSCSEIPFVLANLPSDLGDEWY